MDDLTAFLNARLDEDEAAAKAAGDEAWRPEPFVSADRIIESVYAAGSNCIARCGITDRTDGASQATHIARHDPARALREAGAKRAILALHSPETARHPDYCWHDLHMLPCPTLRSLAAVWSDHPDYRPEWKP